MAGMDLNQNTRDFERDRLAERVNKVERFLDSFEINSVEKVDGQNKIRVNNLRAINGSIQQSKGQEIDIDSGSGSVLDDGDATNRFLVWNTDESAWTPSELAYPAGTTDNRFLVWDDSNSKWVADELIHPAGSSSNRFLTWNTSDEKWTPTELIHPAGDVDNPYLKWSVADSKWEKAAGTMIDPSTVDGHVHETYDNAGTKEVRWGYVRMKDI